MYDVDFKSYSCFFCNTLRFGVIGHENASSGADVTPSRIQAVGLHANNTLARVLGPGAALRMIILQLLSRTSTTI